MVSATPEHPCHWLHSDSAWRAVANSHLIGPQTLEQVHVARVLLKRHACGHGEQALM
jgi:hypothetical protein